jgi:hypothetical protein
MMTIADSSRAPTPGVAARLSEWAALAVLSLTAIRKRFGMSRKYLDRNTSYGKLAGLIEYHNPAAHPARFFFKGENSGSAVMYISAPEALTGLGTDSLRRELGAPAAMLPSRAGKSYTHAVYPEHGVAFSADNTNVAFIELFPATTLERYQAEIYDRPEPFTK